MEAQIIISKFEMLPESVQQQIVDYVDFLTDKYLKILHKKPKKNNDFVLTDEIKDLLNESILHHDKNPEKAKTAEEVLTYIAKKYDYEL